MLGFASFNKRFQGKYFFFIQIIIAKINRIAEKCLPNKIMLRVVLFAWILSCNMLHEWNIFRGYFMEFFPRSIHLSYNIQITSAWCCFLFWNCTTFVSKFRTASKLVGWISVRIPNCLYGIAYAFDKFLCTTTVY